MYNDKASWKQNAEGEEWTEAMISQYAELAAMGVVDNNSCNCLACKVLSPLAFPEPQANF